MPFTSRLAFAAALMLAMLAPCAAAELTIVYLTRHAEKTAAKDDPELTEAGKARAQNIAATLKNAGIGRIYVTKWTRTRQTAQPLATLLGVAPEVYDSPDKLAASLKTAGGTTLVVGHSNTIVKLVNQLGGKGGEEIDENTEFDRLYQVIVAPDGSVTTVRFTSLPPR
jgi:broad specificity phosphatase PhoE